MQFFPPYDVFAKDKSSASLIWAKLPIKDETPVSCLQKLKSQKYCALFESVEKGKRSRYSFIVSDPDLLFKCENGKASIAKLPDLEDFKETNDDIFASLRKLIEESKLDIPSELPSMASGLFGFMSYDMTKYMEVLPDTTKDVLDTPDAIYFRPQIIIIFDHQQGEIIFVTPCFNKEDDFTYQDACYRIENIVSLIESAPIEQDDENADPLDNVNIQSNTSKQQFCQMVDKAKEYIYAGDIFQVVLSQRFSMDFERDDFEIYKELRELNPSPFSFYMKLADFSLIGSSPEILVRVKGGKVYIRPIAGTRWRGKDKAEDKQLAQDLLNDEKEKAEHLMLLDLGRNDIGRVAGKDSVKVTEEMVIEYYSHVMHIVSNVEGTLDKKHDALAALIAGFPAGTVSGAPKIRAMEIIDELEQEKRGYYAGSVGYFSSNGEMDTCITLRTGMVKDGKLYVQAGGGIVADSDPEYEYNESCNKAKAVLKAAQNVLNKS